MVFFRKRMRRVIQVHPQHLGPGLKAHIKEQCTAEVTGERLVSGVGFVILVLAIDEANIGRGLVDHLTGKTRYEVEYDAIVFRPFKNEVLDAVVKVCTSQGIFAQAGPQDVFVARHYIPPDFDFRPEDAAYVSTDTGAVIRADANLRVKVLGANATGQVAAIGTINEPFLGPLN